MSQRALSRGLSRGKVPRGMAYHHEKALLSSRGATDHKRFECPVSRSLELRVPRAKPNIGRVRHPIVVNGLSNPMHTPNQLALTPQQLALHDALATRDGKLASIYY